MICGSVGHNLFVELLEVRVRLDEVWEGIPFVLGSDEAGPVWADAGNRRRGRLESVRGPGTTA